MKEHKAKAQWNGGLQGGNGQVETGRGNVKTGYSFASRFGDDTRATSPEELIGAAHAGCFSMFLAALLEKANQTADSINTSAKVQLGEKDGGPHILKIELTTEVKASGLQNDEFQKLVQDAKVGCPVSKALAAVPEITVDASLVQ